LFLEKFKKQFFYLTPRLFSNDEIITFSFGSKRRTGLLLSLFIFEKYFRSPATERRTANVGPTRIFQRKNKDKLNSSK